MTNAINIKTVNKVLEMSKDDIDIWDILSEFDDEQDEEMVDFIEENRDEFEIFLNTSLAHVMNRLKIRMAFAKNGETNEMAKTYVALAYEFKDRPGVYISRDDFETQNINDAFLYVRGDGLKPDKSKIIEQAKENEENHKKMLENKYEKVAVMNYKPYTWLEYCDLVEVEINESRFHSILEDE